MIRAPVGKDGSFDLVGQNAGGNGVVVYSPTLLSFPTT